MHAPWIVAIDGGTTRTRVRVVQESRIVADIPAAVGVREVARSGSSAPLHDRLAEAIPQALAALPPGEPAPIVVSGMLTSEVGLAAVPHVLAPAGLDDLARGAVWRTFPSITAQPMLLVPGVRTPAAAGSEGWTASDVMRGEECEAFALWQDTPPQPGQGAFYLIPGSHTKLVAMSASGRITASHTTLSGELIAAIAGHTILAASLPTSLPARIDPDWFERGARHVREWGLGRTAFAVRLAALNDQGTPDQRASWLVGAAVAEDVAHLTTCPLLGDPDAGQSLTVAGSDPLRSLYAAQFAASWPGQVLASQAGDTAAALGAALVARRRLEAP